LSLCLGAFFQLCHLLALDGWCSDFLSEDDVADFAGSQGRDIHAVAFAEVLYNTSTRRSQCHEITYSQNQVLHGEFDLDPFFIRQSRPNKVGLGGGAFVRVKDDFRLLVIDMQTTEEKNNARERSIARDCLQPIIYAVRFNIEIRATL
jgi:hypothetical protein